jgi:hypothetical protein
LTKRWVHKYIISLFACHRYIVGVPCIQKER